MALILYFYSTGMQGVAESQAALGEGDRGAASLSKYSHFSPESAGGFMAMPCVYIQ